MQVVVSVPIISHAITLWTRVPVQSQGLEPPRSWHTTWPFKDRVRQVWELVPHHHNTAPHFLQLGLLALTSHLTFCLCQSLANPASTRCPASTPQP